MEQQPLPAERHRLIESLVRQRSSVRVSVLAESLGVSEVTIRRDLEELEGRGVLERTHGGAIRARRMRAEPPFLEAAGRHATEKRTIGRRAARLVGAGETVFLNGGTTTFEVFRHIDAPDVKVVTNHVGMALEAVDRPDLQLILVGGEYRPPSNSCVGAFATETVRRVFANRSFIGVEGLSLRSGLTTPAAPEAEIARVMIEQTQGPVVAVVDHSKVGTVAEFAIAPIERVACLVTDDAIDADYRGELENRGIRVITGAQIPAGSSSGG